MAKTCVWIALWLIAATLALGFTQDNFWPKFGCHPYNDTTSTGMRLNIAPCLGLAVLNHMKNIMCVKVCVLQRLAALARGPKEGQLIFKTDVFVNELKKELGYGAKDTPPKAAQEILNKVTFQLEACLKKNPEFAQLNVKEHSCEPWSNLTTCIDKAVGC